MSLHCFFGMAPGVKGVGSRCVSMVCRLLVLSTFVVFCGFPMVAGGVGMMF